MKGEVDTINPPKDDQKLGGRSRFQFIPDDDSVRDLEPVGHAMPENPQAAARAIDRRPLAEQLVEVFHSINAMATRLYEAGQVAMNTNVIRGHLNETVSIGRGNSNTVDGDGNRLKSDSTTPLVKIVGMVVVAFVAYTVLSK